MKMAVMNYPPMTFRLLSVLLGIVVLYGYFRWKRISLQVPRQEWGLVLRLGVLNMVVWHLTLMIALPHLNSGRASVIGFSMPVFSALWGAWIYKQQVSAIQFMFLALGFSGIALLLANELSGLSGNPAMALLLLAATATWAMGAQQLRRAPTDLNILTIAFWMTAITALGILPVAVITEVEQWAMPSTRVSLAIIYNAVVIFAFCHTAWAVLARELHPLASSISISLIPVIGVLSGAYFLQEQLHWQDGAAILCIGAAVLGTLAPRKTSNESAQSSPSPS